MGCSGLLSLLAAEPARERLHLWALSQIDEIAKRDKGPVSALERIADLALTPARLKQFGGYISFEPLIADRGQREAALLDVLVRRKSARARELVFRALGIMEKTWTRIELAEAAVALAAKLDPDTARPIVQRMVVDPTWNRYAVSIRRFTKAVGG